MQRKDFIHSIIGLSAMTTLSSFNSLANEWKEQDEKMPVLFVGHGNPMNAIEDNEYSRGWRSIAASIPKPTAILMVSAHWETKGTYVTAMEKPKTIHDFGGFPQELFNVEYPAPGKPELAKEVKEKVKKTEIKLDYDW